MSDENPLNLPPSSLVHRTAGRSWWRTLKEGRSAALWPWSPAWGPDSRLWWSRTQWGQHSSGATSRKVSAGLPSGCGLTSTWCWRSTRAPTRSTGRCWGRITAKGCLSTRRSMQRLKVGVSPLDQQGAVSGSSDCSHSRRSNRGEPLAAGTQQTLLAEPSLHVLRVPAREQLRGGGASHLIDGGGEGGRQLRTRHHKRLRTIQVCFLYEKTNGC